LEIEDKPYSIAVHYRRSRGKREAQTAIARVTL
jgi:trehalose-6-phosphatase